MLCYVMLGCIAFCHMIFPLLFFHFPYISHSLSHSPLPHSSLPPSITPSHPRTLLSPYLPSSCLSHVPLSFLPPFLPSSHPHTLSHIAYFTPPLYPCYVMSYGLQFSFYFFVPFLLPPSLLILFSASYYSLFTSSFSHPYTELRSFILKLQAMQNFLNYAPFF